MTGDAGDIIPFSPCSYPGSGKYPDNLLRRYRVRELRQYETGQYDKHTPEDLLHLLVLTEQLDDPVRIGHHSLPDELGQEDEEQEEEHCCDGAIDLIFTTCNSCHDRDRFPRRPGNDVPFGASTVEIAGFPVEPDLPCTHGLITTHLNISFIATSM